ncbi:MAG: hypothetical protein AAF845_03260 [Bacteroidota bacterium]
MELDTAAPEVAPASPDRSLDQGQPAPAPEVEAAPPDPADAAVDAAYAADRLGEGVPTDVLDRALVARAEMAAQYPGQDPRAVTAAVQEITERLDSRFTNPVTHNDLEQIQQTVEGLSPAEATRVFERLTDDQLREWGEQLHDVNLPGLGGFDRDERVALYGVLAERLDGAQLARFADALDTPPTGADGQLLGAAIAEHAPAAVRIGFVREASDLVEQDPEAAFAVAETLGGLRGVSLDGALRTLSPEELRAVVDASVETHTHTAVTMAGGHITVSHDADTFGRLAEALATSQDAGRKAIVVSEAVEQLREVETRGNLGMSVMRGDSPEVLRDGLTSILESDVGGVVEALEQGVDREGRALTGYFRSMVADDRTEEVGRLLVDLGTDGGTRTSAEWATEQVPGDQDGALYYANAQTLGYAVGAVGAAVDEITGNARAQAETLKNIFGSTLGVAGGAHPAAGAPAAILTGLGNEVINATVERHAAGHRDLKATLRDLAFPQVEGADGVRRPYNGGAETDYDAAALRVIDANR